MCPCCSSNVMLSDKRSSRMGFAHCLEIVCNICDWRKSFYTSKTCDTKNSLSQGRNIYESNLRMVIGFRENGKGLSGIEAFARCMNMFSLANNSFENLQSQLAKAYESVAKMSMKRAADSFRSDCDTTEPIKKRVKINGAWQKRGHQSLNGFVTAIIDDKCVDIEAFSKFCSGCKMWDSKKETPGYELWKATYNCSINHIKSSGFMESAGAINIFNRSVEKNSIIYDEYLGDGDSSSFKEVIESVPYKAYNVVPEKLECIGHAQKRMGTDYVILLSLIQEPIKHLMVEIS